MNEITYKQVLTINTLCLLGEEPFVVLDENRIKSALGNQFAPYPNVEYAFASVYKSLVINHGFANGNKRTGVLVLYLASQMIDNPLTITDEEFAKLTYQIAGEGGSLIPVDEIATKVFKNPIKNATFKDINDYQQLIKQYVNDHQWLMEELAK